MYNSAIVPIVQEVLDGFNCTIFAYGQTGAVVVCVWCVFWGGVRVCGVCLHERRGGGRGRCVVGTKLKPTKTKQN